MRNLKKWIAALLALCMACQAAGALAVSASLNQRMATRSGPGTKYTEELGTFPQSTQITVIEQVTNNETTWVLVEFRSNGSLYRAYTGLKRVNVSGYIPYGSTTWYTDTVTYVGRAYYGPGYQYAARSVQVYQGQTVYVYETENGWALCEYTENGRNVRAYLPADILQVTTGYAGYQSVTNPPVTNPPVTTPPYGYAAGVTVVSLPPPACVDYYGNAFDYSRHSVDFARLVSKLPVMNYMDGVRCTQSAAVYGGPGYSYWRSSANGSVSTADSTLRVYGKQNGWALIRYGGSTGLRYGWITVYALPAAQQQWTGELSLASETVVAAAATRATAEPDGYIGADDLTVPQGTRMTALAFLDQSRAWVLCEFSVTSSGRTFSCRGFVPADDLRLE